MTRNDVLRQIRIDAIGRYKRPSATQTPFALKGRDWIRAQPEIREYLVEIAFRFWRRQGFPNFEFSKEAAQMEFIRLLNFDWHRVYAGNRLRGPGIGLGLANSFHPAMWSVRVSRYRSPMDVFENDLSLRSAIRRALTIWPERYSANASCLRRMLKTFSGAASVSNFKPLIAKGIIGKYSKAGDLVVDFCAGYGGRLLGCLTLPRDYLGIDPCKDQVLGLRKMLRSLSSVRRLDGVAEILEGRAEEELCHLPSNTANLVFSSPPYFDWERYSGESTQSSVRYKTYQEWLENFMKPVISESSRLLKSGGYLVLNVTNGKRNPTRREMSRLARLFGFVLEKTYHLTIPKIPYLHPRDGLAHKSECILVFARH